MPLSDPKSCTSILKRLSNDDKYLFSIRVGRHPSWRICFFVLSRLHGAPIGASLKMTDQDGVESGSKYWHTVFHCTPWVSHWETHIEFHIQIILENKNRNSHLVYYKSEIPTSIHNKPHWGKKRRHGLRTASKPRNSEQWRSPGASEWGVFGGDAILQPGIWWHSTFKCSKLFMYIIFVILSTTLKGR